MFASLLKHKLKMKKHKGEKGKLRGEENKKGEVGRDGRGDVGVGFVEFALCLVWK